jgi:predicted metal-dependent peptidase
MAAKIVAQNRWPYLSTVIFSLKLVPTDELPTLAVDDGWRMYYNPTFVLEHAAEVLATMVLHEALHCINKHGERFSSLSQPPETHNLWNLAGDANINQVIDDSKMPWGEFSPIRYENLSRYSVKESMTTETAFFSMIKYFEENPQKPKYVSDCGSVQGGHNRDYEITKGNLDNPAIKKDQQDVIRDRVAHDILKQAKEKDIGSLPGALLRWAQDRLQPQINWREALASAVRSSLATSIGRRDYVFTRPSRRQDAMKKFGFEVVLPAMRKPSPPPIAVVIDTSGSISNKEVDEFLAEVSGIARANGVAQGLTIITCDAEVSGIRKLRSRSEISELELKGGGGTDLRVGIAAAIALRPIPKVIIVITDGYTPWPETITSKIESLIICCSVFANMETIPAFAKGILIE